MKHEAKSRDVEIKTRANKLRRLRKYVYRKPNDFQAAKRLRELSNAY